MIKSIYKETKNCVITAEGVSSTFITHKGVRQGCPLSPVLFNIFIEDLDEECRRKKLGGTVIGSEKIYSLKFADDVVLVADDKEGLGEMLKSLEKFASKNELEVNSNKTKIMIFKKGGRRGKDEKWSFKQKELEVVNRYKYLGCWFAANNSFRHHIRIQAGKVQKSINAAWGVIKRAKIDKLSQRIHVLDMLVSSVLLYGVEIWGWKVWEEVEVVQNRFVKMVLGLDRNTPAYIWRTESDRRKIGVQARKRAGMYIIDIAKMSDERWPKICLKEEIRNIGNRNPSEWGKEFQKALHEVGNGITLQLLQTNSDIELIKERMGEDNKIRIEQNYQEDWAGIEKSTYCDKYKYRKNQIGQEKYWNECSAKGWMKEQWARLRCGNIGKIWYGKSEMKDLKQCRICEEEEENIYHIWICKGMQDCVSNRIKGWLDHIKGPNIEIKIEEMLKGHLVKEACEFCNHFEKKARENKM